MNILLNGICGHMGREVERLCFESYRSARLICGVDIAASEGERVPVYTSFDNLPSMNNVDCIIDFSHHTSTAALFDFAVMNGIPAVIATTGHTESEVYSIRRAAESIPVFFSANMSLGVALLVELAKNAARAMPDAQIEIIEKHHDRKVDAPSGTALMLATAIIEDSRKNSYINAGRLGQGRREREEIGIHSVRMGNIVGEHEVIIGTPSQTITLKHEAHSRALFAEGALAAAEFIVNADPGLYDMNSLIAKNSKDRALA